MKTQITQKQAYQFNIMLNQLKKISKQYQTPAQLRKGSQGEYGIDFEEALEMSYENIQNEAAFGCKGVKAIVIPITTK